MHTDVTQYGFDATALVARLGGLLAAAFVSACSPPPPYEATAAALVRTEVEVASGDFSTEWKPLRKNFSEALSDEEEAHRKFWLSSCVNELAARFTPAPNANVRAAQIAECMEARGWHLVVRESK